MPSADGRRARASAILGGMLGHIGVNVPDLDAARRYYSQLMPLLGFETFLDHADEIAYRPAGGKQGTYVFFYPASDVQPFSRHRPGLQHLAFMVPTRESVRVVWQRALDLGSVDVHAPQQWPQYPPPYYAAFWLDPFGFMLEAVCHHDG